MKDIKNAISHLKEHQKYPATRQELIDECQKLSDFSDEDKKWFMDNLPEKTYQSADEVIKALGLQAQTETGMGEDKSMSV